MALLTASRKKPPQTEPQYQGVLVKYIEAQLKTRSSIIRGNGTVKPRFETQLSSQVPGKITWVNPDFVAGGSFNKGEVLLRIEPDDYELAVKQAEAVVSSAEFGLAVEKANSEVARSEWQAMKKANIQLSTGSDNSNSEPDALVLREPQLRQANANLESAQAALEKAKLALKRTEIIAPFNCLLRMKMADPGQYVNPGQTVAVVYSIDIAEIQVGVPITELLQMKIPGASAKVVIRLNGRTFTWKGVVQRTLGTIDERERLAQVVVQVKNPLKKRSAEDIELNIGSFVEVEIEGKNFDSVIPLPYQCLRSNSEIWIIDEDDRLSLKEVTVDRKTNLEIWISSGLEPGEKVIYTSVSGAAQGMKLRPVLLSSEGVKQ